jgi:hypothetical protein
MRAQQVSLPARRAAPYDALAPDDANSLPLIAKRHHDGIPTHRQASCTPKHTRGQPLGPLDRSAASMRAPVATRRARRHCLARFSIPHISHRIRSGRIIPVTLLPFRYGGIPSRYLIGAAISAPT